MVSDWQHTTLGEFLSLQRGHDLTEQERRPGVVPVMGAAGQNGCHDTAKAKGPGIVIGRSGGSFGQVHLSKRDFWPHNTALYVKDFKGNDRLFTYYFLRILDFDRLNSGSAQPSLNRNYVYPVKIHVPKPRQQKKIATVLSTIDAKIDINIQICQKLEGMVRLLYEYWFLQCDFPITAAQAAEMEAPHLEGKPYRSSGGEMVYNEVLKREIPDGWDVMELSCICQNVRESVEPLKIDPETPYVGLEHIPRRRFFLDAWETARSVSSSKNRFKSNDFLFGKLRPYFHKVVKMDVDGVCSSDVLVLRAKQPKYQAILGTIVFSDFFVEFASKGWGGAQMPRASWNLMKQLKVPIPPDDLLDSFNDKVLPFWAMGDANQNQNRKLSELRDWLLPMLMNGQVTVR